MGQKFSGHEERSLAGDRESKEALRICRESRRRRRKTVIDQGPVLARTGFHNGIIGELGKGCW